jgi:uncharacterized protein YkwD
MKLRLVILMLIAAFVVPVSHAAVSAAPRQGAVNPTARRIIELINRNRAAAGLAPVSAQGTLMAEAQRFSGVQAQLGRVSHRGVDGSTAGQRLTRAGYRWSFWGENLAAGQETADQVVGAWMASPGHRANIMNAKGVHIGIGHTFRTNDPSGYYDYWVMEIGRPR